MGESSQPGEGVERRKSPRFVVDLPVQVTGSFGVMSGRACDICRDAVWIEGERALAQDADVTLSIEFPDTSAPTEIYGRVIRIGAGERFPHGMAVLFMGVAPTAATEIDIFIEAQSDPG